MILFEILYCMKSIKLDKEKLDLYLYWCKTFIESCKKFFIYIGFWYLKSKIFILKNFQIISMLLLPVYFILPTGDSHFTICPFFHLTGSPCPGCGMGRSLVHIFHLHFIKAFYYNPYGFLIAAIQCYLIVSLFFPKIIFMYESNRSYFKSIEYTVAFLFIAFGGVRFWAFYTGNTFLLKYFYNFNETFSLIRWILS